MQNSLKNKSKTILVAGGYGHGNTGDEAQCSETLKLLSARYPDHQIKNLTPNPAYSHAEHKSFFHDFASRVLFYNQGLKGDCYWLRGVGDKFRFLLSSLIVYLNAFLVREDLPTIFINARKAKMLQELKDCGLLYFCGGGYLTGGTLSRLWEGIFLCRLCHLFKTPVVMSGQTIGIWRGKFNKAYAKWGFKHVKLITVRDKEFSLKDLAQIGLEGENYFYTHDDALFCEKSDKPFYSKSYITLSFHYWGMQEAQKSVYTEKINKIVRHILENSDFEIVFIPMQATDKESFDHYIKKFPDGRVSCFEYDYDFKKVRRVIADSKMCVTMKHHPIIFAAGEEVPSISLAFSDYYVHKNIGALAQYGIEDFSVNLEDEKYLENFEKLFARLMSDNEAVIKTIHDAKEDLKARREIFLKKVDDILLNL